MALDLMSLRAKLFLDDSQYEQGLSDAKGGLQDFAKSAKKVLAAVGFGVAVKKGVDGIVSLTKSAVKAYGEFEQLSGGVETLFKDSADAVKQHAQEAYKTAGLSANEYMKTVTSFSASLIQSTGRGEQKDIAALKKNLDDQYDATKRYWEERIRLTKDSSKKASLRYQMQDELKALKAHNKEAIAEAERTNRSSKSTSESIARAADLADLAVRDMSDNANKFGSDMSSIQNAYAGFSKQNYTMLDNLKLGYGGTKEEMERLLQDAEKLTGKKYDLSSYADIVEAIHAIQDEMGITGTTAAEAEKTIEGSIASTKAAWENVLTSIGSGKDMKTATANLVKSAKNVIKNVKPVIKRALSGIGDLIAGLAPVLLKEGPLLIMQLLPSIVKSVGKIVGGVAKSLPSAISDLWNTVKNVLLTNGVQKIALFLNELITGGADKSFGPAQQRIQNRLTKLFNSIFTLGSTILEKAKAMWDTIVDAVQPVLQSLLSFVVDKVMPILTSVFKFLTDNFDAIAAGIGTIVGVIAAMAIADKINNVIGIIKTFFAVVKAHPFAIILTVIGAVIGYLVHLYQTNEDARDKINAAFDAIKGFWENTLKPAFEDIYTYIVETLIPALIEWWDTKLKPTIENVFTAIVGFWNDTLKPALVALYDYIVTDLIPTLIVWWEDKLKPTVETVFNAIVGFWNDTLKPALEDIYTYVVETLIPTLIEWWDTKLKPTIETVFTAIAGFWNDTLKPAFEAIYTYVVDTLIPTLQEKWEAIQPIIENVFTAIKTFWEETAQPALQAFWDFINDKIMPIVGDLGTTFQDVWDKYLKPVADWINDVFVIYWQTLQTQMQNLLDFITAVFSGQWGDAWDALVAMVATPFEGLKEILKTPINAVIELINNMIRAVRDSINTVIEGINNKLKITIPAISVSWEGFSVDYDNPWWKWSPNLKTVNWADNVIPKLARGGIVSNGGSAIVGEYQPEFLQMVNGKAVVTPLNTGRFPGGGQEIVTPRAQKSQMINLTLQIKDTEIARVLVPLLETEEQRRGVRLATGGAY